jgi:hypothetical protein
MTTDRWCRMCGRVIDGEYRDAFQDHLSYEDSIMPLFDMHFFCAVCFADPDLGDYGIWKSRMEWRVAYELATEGISVVGTRTRNVDSARNYFGAAARILGMTLATHSVEQANGTKIVYGHFKPKGADRCHLRRVSGAANVVSP